VIGYLGYRAARGQWRLYQKSRSQKGGPWTLTAMLFGILPFTVLWFLTSFFQQHWGTFGVLAGVNAVLLWLTLLSAGFFARRSYTRLAEHAYAAGPGITPEVLRARAAELRELEELREQAGRGEVTGASTATWQSVPGQDEQPDPAETERKRRVSDLLSVACPEDQCLARPPVPCVMGQGIPFIIVDRERITLCHVERALEAVRSGTADASEVLAQFGLEGAQA
jgi:hypothetical protein